MAQKNSELADAVRDLADATLIDLPLLAIARLFNSPGSDKELRTAGWKAYDAGVAIATDLTNRLYTSPRVGRAVGRAIDVSLKFQRFMPSELTRGRETFESCAMSSNAQLSGAPLRCSRQEICLWSPFLPMPQKRTS